MLLAFHSNPAIQAKYITRVENHIRLDHLHRGETGQGGRGCAVWCTLDAYDHARYPVELGIPEWLARVEDTLFEGMSLEKSRTWPRDFLTAIKPGADLEKAKALFLIMVLESALSSFDHAKFPDVKAAIDGSIALWWRDDIGSADWDKAAMAAAEAAWVAARAETARAEAREAWAARAAWAAARAALEAWAAAEAAWAALEAWAKYDEFADGLLKILSDLEPECQRQIVNA